MQDVSSYLSFSRCANNNIKYRYCIAPRRLYEQGVNYFVDRKRHCVPSRTAAVNLPVA